MELEQLRANIDEIDDRILALLCKRAEIAEQIGHYKIDNKMSVEHSEREEKILLRLTKQNHSVLSSEDVSIIFKNIIRACRDLQKNLI